jgi:hypothetical protein
MRHCSTVDAVQFCYLRRFSLEHGISINRNWNFSILPTVILNLSGMRSTTSSVGIVFAFLVLIAAVFHESHALTNLETITLAHILASFPDLAFVTHEAQYPDYGLDYGHAWNADFSSLCSNGAGFDFYGLHCDATGHIDLIRLYALHLASAFGLNNPF